MRITLHLALVAALACSPLQAEAHDITAKLQVHEEGKMPLLCVTGTYKVASGNLSLPGVIMRKDK